MSGNMYKFNTTVEPLWVSKVRLYPGQTVKAHAHEYYYHLVYIISGRCSFTINGQPYTLSDNMLTIAKPGEIFSWCNNSEQPVTTYEVKFSILDDELREAIGKLPPIIFSTLFVKTLLEKIANERDSRREDFAEYISIYLNVLLYDLKREEVPGTSSDKRVEENKSPVQIVSSYIEEHYGDDDLSLGKIAEAIGFNKSYLATAFKQGAGITVNEYIYRARVYKSCELIAYSDLPLAEVGSMTGFKNVQHFNRVFKKHIGIPPGEYRSATPKKLIDYENASGTAFNAEVLPVRSGRSFKVESDSGFYRLDEKSEK